MSRFLVCSVFDMPGMVLMDRTRTSEVGYRLSRVNQTGRAVEGVSLADATQLYQHPSW